MVACFGCCERDGFGLGAGAELLKGEMMAAAKFVLREHESQIDARNSFHDDRRISSLLGK